MNVDRLLAHYETDRRRAQTPSLACAVSFSIWPCAASWWRRTRTTSRRRILLLVDRESEDAGSSTWEKFRKLSRRCLG